MMGGTLPEEVTLTARLGVDFRRATFSFRRISSAEAAALQPLRIKVVRVGPGDTSRRLADKFPFEAFRLRWFEILNGLSPGPTETPALGKLGLEAQAEAALRDDIQALVPIGRMGTPLELAKAAVFLASDESAFVVGTELLVDGGVKNL